MMIHFPSVCSGPQNVILNCAPTLNSLIPSHRSSRAPLPTKLPPDCCRTPSVLFFLRNKSTIQYPDDSLCKAASRKCFEWFTICQKKQKWACSPICCRIRVPSVMLPSCQRFSSGGSLGKLVLPKALIFLAFRESPSNSVYLFTLRLHALCCCWLLPAGSSWRDIAPRWRPRICGPWGKRTHRIRSSLSCRRNGQLNVPRSKSKSWQNLI